MKKRRIILVGLVSVLAACLLMGITFFLFRILRGDVTEKTDDLTRYHQWSLPEKYSQLLVFPEKVPNSAEDTVYFYRYESGYTRPMCQIFLSCRLSEDDFDREEKRLSSLSYTSEADGRKTVHYDGQSFQSPAYVTIEGYDFCYEYALLDGENRSITYVYTMNTVESDIGFDRQYLPDYFMEDFDELSVSGLDRYTMYERYQKEN